ncbi:N-acetylmuramoyl-L-alanine amidase [Streptomyces monticola]|uniref:N-acetylmuramoyl-L-alanine amidase n=1 Tax=Streptomyces monticola TaxID=2666263 RepID=A0ABW2JUJ7_9ACTN
MTEFQADVDGFLPLADPAENVALAVQPGEGEAEHECHAATEPVTGSATAPETAEVPGAPESGREREPEPVGEAVSATTVRQSYLVKRAAWGARPPKEVSRRIWPGRGGVAVHHHGGKPLLIDKHSECHEAVRSTQKDHMDGNGWDDIAYTYLVCPHGYVFEGRGPGVRTAANGTDAGNDNYYAVCALVGGQWRLALRLYDKITDELLSGISMAIAQLRSIGGAGAQIVGHRQLTSTTCPSRLYEYVKNGRLEPGTDVTPPDDSRKSPERPDGDRRKSPDDEAPEFPGVLLHYPPVTVHWSVRIWQQRMRDRGWNISVDGSYGAQSRRVCIAFQREKHLPVDGVVGPRTWKAAWNAPDKDGGVPGVPDPGGPS